MLRRMFDIAYLLGKEKLSFRKYPAICEVKVRHGVNLGSAYKMETASKMFTHYIAESERQKLLICFLLCGSTRKG